MSAVIGGDDNLARAHALYTYAKQDREKAQAALSKAQAEELKRAKEYSSAMLQTLTQG